MGGHLAKPRDGFLGQAITEVFLCRIAAQIFEWKDSQHDAGPLCFREQQRHSSRSSGAALKAITLARNGLNVQRVVRVLPKGPTNFSDRRVDAIVRVEVHAFAPEALDYFVPADQSPTLADQEHEQIHRDALQPNGLTQAGKFVAACVQDELSEANSF